MAYESPLPRRIYILGDGLLFDDIIAHMLASVTNLRVIRRVYAGESTVVSEVEASQPDIVLLTETDRYNREQMLGFLSQLSLETDLRIMVMSVEHQDIRILDRPARADHRWSGTPHTIQGVDDWNELFDLIAGKQLREGTGRYD